MIRWVSMRRHHAGVAKLADAQDLKSWAAKAACGFDSHPRHQEGAHVRTVLVFVAGILVGVAAQAALAQNGQSQVQMMNHVGINVPNIPEAITYYTQKMGYKEAFRATNDKGEPTLVYLHISRDTFLELGQANAQRPAGFTHYGLVVNNSAAAVSLFKQRGVTVSEPNVSANTKAILANITDPYMGRIELAEITPDSLHRKALDSWK
jgi:catechol 2,3-dioxygenase-like lactoylglutathione lyase family enzyme